MSIKMGTVRIELSQLKRREAEERKACREPTMRSVLLLLLPIVFLGGHLPGRSNGHPVYGSELAGFKALLERLEDKLEPRAGEAGLERDFNEANDEAAGEDPQTFAAWDDEYPKPPSQGGFGRSDGWSSERVPPAARSRLGALLTAPRRVSNCFGQRIDRIGSSSGLGCKRSRN
nr:natriuretic peptides A-like [Pogona vitticeps]